MTTDKAVQLSHSKETSYWYFRDADECLLHDLASLNSLTWFAVRPVENSRLTVRVCCPWVTQLSSSIAISYSPLIIVMVTEDRKVLTVDDRKV